MKAGEIMRFGWMELLLIAGLALIIIGPKRFGLVGKSAKQGIKEFKEIAKDEKEKQKEE